MFRGYLKEHPPFFQLSVFIGLWSILQLITVFLIPKLIQWTYPELGTAANITAEQDAFAFLWINGVSSILCFILPPVLFSSIAAPKPVEYLQMRIDNAKRIGIGVVAAAGMVLLFPAMAYLMSLIDWGEAANHNLEVLKQRNEALFSQKTTGALLRNLLFLALIPAIGEELFFRGMMQRFMNTWLKKPMYAILMTSILFSLIHFQIINFFPIFFASIILGYIFHITGNLGMSIWVHFVYNGLQVCMRYFSEDSSTNTSIGTVVLYIVGGFLMVLLGLWLFNKTKTPLPRLWGEYMPEDPQLKQKED